MVNLVYIFWMYVVLFAVIGAMRGWAKELLVSFSVILALALNYLLRKYVPMIINLPPTEPSLFWIRTWITVALVYFGYQTVASIGALSGKARNLLGTEKKLSFREIREGNAIYYIAELSHTNEERFKFIIDVTQNGTNGQINFEQTFFVD